MDYKYIEQLLERYWEAQTTEEEERILRAFFRQEELPEHLARYASLFVYEREASKQTASQSLEQRLLRKAAEIEATTSTHVVYAQRVSTPKRFMPMLRAAAAVAAVLLVSVTAQHALRSTDVYDMGASGVAGQRHIPSQKHGAFEAGVNDAAPSGSTVAKGIAYQDSTIKDTIRK